MSPSDRGEGNEPAPDDEVREAARRLHGVLESPGAVQRADWASIQDVLGAAVRLYAARATQEAPEGNAVSDEVSATDVVLVASALLKAQNLNTFDLALWWGRESSSSTS